MLAIFANQEDVGDALLLERMIKSPSLEANKLFLQIKMLYDLNTDFKRKEEKIRIHIQSKKGRRKK